ncbi:MAG: hypothetical protein F6K35_34700, partial [Okeania sp. SIO2H7]|nr:hypothetical protein [Okeania sp. SIO2H7]
MTCIKIKLLEGGENRYLVSLTSSDGKFESCDRSMPPLPSELKSSLKTWRQGYYELDGVRKVMTRLSPKSVAHCCKSDDTKDVKKLLNQWLNTDEDKEWRSLRDELISRLTQLKASGQELRLFIDAENLDLQRLPWQEWDLLKSRFYKAGIGVRIRGDGDVKPF